MKLSVWLKRYRIKRGLRQKELAGDLGISREHYAQIESGHCRPSINLLRTMSRKLSVTIVVTISKIVERIEAFK